MRVVLDTNVLVSALLNPQGPPAKILRFILEQTITLLLNEQILYEYREVLRRPRFGFEEYVVDGILASLDQIAEYVVAKPLKIAIPDPDDLPFLEVAIAGAAEALITGNKKDYGTKITEISILSPSEFLSQFLKKS